MTQTKNKEIEKSKRKENIVYFMLRIGGTIVGDEMAMTAKIPGHKKKNPKFLFSFLVQK